MNGLTKLEVQKVIDEEPEMPGSIFKVLGFWRGLWSTVIMVTRPYHSARAAVRATKLSLRRRVDGMGVNGDELH